MISSTYHEPQTAGVQKHNRLIAARIPIQQHQSQEQVITDQRNMSFVDNNSFLPSSTQTNNLNYLQPRPIMCQNLSPPSQLHQQTTTPLHAHSIVTTMNNTQMPSLGPTSNGIFDARIGRLYSTGPNTTDFVDSGLNSISNLPNTILINNYTQQLQPEQTAQHLYQQHSIHSTQQSFQHHLPTNLTLQHNSSANHHHQQNTPHSLQQAEFYSQPHMSTASTSSQTMQLHLPTTQSFFVSADAFGTGTNAKISAYMPPVSNSTLASNLNDVHVQQQLPITSTRTPPTSTSTNSPVVLDRINICINNHYSDPGVMPTTATAGISSAMMPEDTPQLPSPIIPSIQHSGAIDPALLMDSLASQSEITSNTCVSTPVPPVIHEPDSTTTSNTPPTTPENSNPNSTFSASIIQSPSTSSTASESEHLQNHVSGTDNSNKTKSIESENPHKTQTVSDTFSNKVADVVLIETDICFTPVLSHALEIQHSMPSTPEVLYAIGEDVFVRKEDDRLYLGTIIDSRYQKYRVRFDDKSELWCSSKDMRKFGGFGDTSTSPGETSHDDGDGGILCVSCKRRDQTGIEICERCGRGYHHKCTTEITPASDNWLCKRCDKPMKLDPSEKSEDQKFLHTRKQFPYDLNSLTWDAKHRVNQEQIYCYCGKSGQFDHNMLQCCKCLNWFHTACIEDFKGPMLRGDGNFVFCCSICSTDGKEFMRRLQIKAVDFIHLVLYNLSAQRKHQQHKYHHLTKDIWPFVLAHRHTTVLPEEWYDISEDALKDRIATTLKTNPDRFVCGREVKRDCYYYGLRANGPPIPQKINIEEGDVLSDAFICKRLRLKLFNRELKPSENKEHTISKIAAQKGSSTQLDVYEFDEDEKFTSDDEIPIKHILEKEKRNKQPDDEEQISAIKLKLLTAPKEKDCQISNIEGLQTSDSKLVKENEKRNHKRKAFTLSKPYKETAAAAASKQYQSARNCDSSSDENSSSSRGTSLDLIIPPPKDFLGLNNPFRNVTPKKSSDKKVTPYSRYNPGGPAIKNSFLNTSSLDFSSKLAALKSAGIFPNLNATNLAKAAGQPRMVRTIKRRLSAKDIMIGPNQEVRRRRTRRLSANVEVISTTTINPLPSNIFPLNAKDLFTSGGAANAPNTSVRKQNVLNSLHNPASFSPPQSSSNSSTSLPSLKEQRTSLNKEDQPTSSTKPPTHGRRLRTRIQKPVPNNSRRNSLSGASTSSTSSSCSAIPTTVSYPDPPTFNDLQQSVNKYFGAGNRIIAGEKFSVYAKRILPNGQVQYLIEWGNENNSTDIADSTTAPEVECAQGSLDTPSTD